MHGHFLRGFVHPGMQWHHRTSDPEWLCRRRRAGIDIFRVFDSLNYTDNLKFGIDAVHAAGGVAEGTICYTGDILNPVFHPKV
jgi:pyruvate carboxylase